MNNINHKRAAIVILLDRSGSMQSIKEDIVGGLQTFISDQKKLAGNNDLFFMAQFDTEYDVLIPWTTFNSELEFPTEKFVPRGSTALYDSMDRTIDNAINFFNTLNPNDRPDKVLFVTLTDGANNASKTSTKAKIGERIKLLTAEKDWDFSFIGANFDVFAEGSGMGVLAANTMAYDTSDKGSIRGMGASLSAGVATYRTTNSKMAFAPIEDKVATPPVKTTTTVEVKTTTVK
jgi:uncharacterized protein YegL